MVIVALFVDDVVWVVDFGLDSILVLCLEIMLAVIHEAVTNYHRVTIKYLMQGTGMWEMFVNEIKENLAHISS
jgi:hypothetical protein